MAKRLDTVNETLIDSRTAARILGINEGHISGGWLDRRGFVPVLTERATNGGRRRWWDRAQIERLGMALASLRGAAAALGVKP